ncbi:major facilitator superfamily domain-containing protein [Dichotomocladium elegans]|nr:major facilitator superfamily domain-containing protein [Dichotomocladium elegans]
MSIDSSVDSSSGRQAGHSEDETHRPLLQNHTGPSTSHPRKDTWHDLKPYIRPLLATNFISIVCGINDGCIGALIPRLKEFYDIPNQTVSLLFLLNAFGYLISAFANGHIVHTFGQLNALYIGGTLLLCAYTIISLGLPFPVMATLMLFQGMGVALLDAGMNVFTTTVPKATLMLNILHAMYGVGAMTSPLISSMLLHFGVSWKAMYLVLALVSVFNMLLMFTCFRHIKMDSGSEEISEEHQKNILRVALVHPMTILCSLYILVYVGVEVTVGGWGLTFLKEGRHGNEAAMSNVVAAYWAALAVGRIVLGYLVEKFGEKPSITACTFFTCVTFMVLWWISDVVIDAMALVTSGFLLGPMFPSTVSLVSKVLPRHLHPAAIGFIAATGAGGAAFFPFLTGQVSGHFGILSMPIVCLLMTITMQILWILVPSGKNEGRSSENQTGQHLEYGSL